MGNASRTTSVERLREVPLESLSRRCDLSRLPFRTTEELKDLAGPIGQERAVEAVRFGIGIRRKGYNLFALGAPGTGRHTLVRQSLQEKAATEPRPPDWCYVHNFAQPHKPRALRLPAGRGAELRRDLARLVEDLTTSIPAAFRAEEYRVRRQAIEDEIKEKQAQAFETVDKQARERGIAILRTPMGVAFAPLRDGEIMSPDELRKLPDKERERLETEVSAIKERVQETLQKVPQWEWEGRERTRELDREITMHAVGHLIDQTRRKYADLAEVLAYLGAVQDDVIANASEFRPADDDSMPQALRALLPERAAASQPFGRYRVNLLVDHSGSKGAPVVLGENPGFANLTGRVEHVSQMGALVTDFNLIKPGLLHLANGGYLILDVQKVLMQPYAWEALKQALASEQIRIESLAQALSLLSTVSLEPESIPLDVKVVLVGPPLLYYLLARLDPEFNDLFKVAADFEEEIPRNDENTLLYARLIATLARREGLRPLDRDAVATVIDRSSRLASDQEKLTARLQIIDDILRESDYLAGSAGRGIVTVADVQEAVAARIRRSDRLRDRTLEEIRRGTILIDTEGTKVGQINGLSVLALGEFVFGRPVRITARVRMGRGEVVDIEREVELGGPLHSKGVLILSGFLGARYAADRPLSLSASLVFEQSYGAVEGDSASSAELFALLSALAGAPIRQDLAVTGSVNQRGQVQPIGGVNEKIEGFFDLCASRTLSGTQGVLIPAANVKHLMLRKDVIEAIAAGKFHVYAIETIDQGIEILTGVEAGERDAAGLFPEGTLNRRVEARLEDLARGRAAWGAASASPREGA
jgi:lon-related putative ATP-dependent protease